MCANSQNLWWEFWCTDIKGRLWPWNTWTYFSFQTRILYISDRWFNDRFSSEHKEYWNESVTDENSGSPPQLLYSQAGQLVPPLPNYWLAESRLSNSSSLHWPPFPLGKYICVCCLLLPSIHRQCLIAWSIKLIIVKYDFSQGKGTWLECDSFL